MEKAMENDGRQIRRVVLAICLCLAGQSCNSRTSKNSPEAALPTWLKEEQGRASSESAIPVSAPAPSAELGLNLKVGDQFPLRKVVQQELIQQSITGTPVRNFSQLELMMAISVLERQDERTKLGVRYHRVKYQHDIAEEHVAFDSSQPGGGLSPGMQAYRDMVNDGFAFWVGEDNQIVEVDGLADFINRCLRHISPEDRQNVVLGIEAGSGESGIANFVDNTIGLLPYGRRTSPGDTWERQQQIARPIPMHISNTYTLKDLGNQLAVIDVRGTITPSTTLNTVAGEKGVQVTVNGGNTLGSCTIYRETGLPKESRVDRIVEMTVVMENSISFRQTKRITTTVESFPAANTIRDVATVRAPAVSPGSRQPVQRQAVQRQPIQQTSGELRGPSGQ